MCLLKVERIRVEHGQRFDSIDLLDEADWVKGKLIFEGVCFILSLESSDIDRVVKFRCFIFNVG